MSATSPMQCPKCSTQNEEGKKFCTNCGAALEGGSEPGPDVMIGQTLGGKYKVIRLLGEGGMGAVYEGEQQLGTTKRKVAVKTLHPHLSRDAKVKARFEREVGTIAELEHPNTIQVYDFGTSDAGILYIVMEFLQGKSLADLLEKEGPMVPDRVAHIMEQICGSLGEAHGRGIVHRDLKPDNVVLVERAGKKDFVKVLDFGIAKRSKEEDKNEQKLTQQGMVLGTPPYMSPEQFTGKPIDARSDIYSLAVMAYEMLTGKLPFKADTAWEWATQHMTQNPIPIESLAEGMRAPEAMRDAIRKALAKSPDDRFQTVGDFNTAFEGGVGQPSRGGTAPIPAAAAGGGGRQKTEMGAPLDVGAAFGAGAGAPMGAPPMAGAPAPAAFTPAAGNMAMPTPGVPQPPSRDDGGNKNRGLILGALGVVGIASVILIVFAVKGSGGGPAKPLPSSTITSDPVTVLSGSAPPVDSEPPIASGDLPPLNGSSSGAHGGSGGGSGGHSGSGSGGKPPPYDGPDCQTARRLKAAGQAKQAQSYVLSCIAHGGNPN